MVIFLKGFNHKKLDLPFLIPSESNFILFTLLIDIGSVLRVEIALLAFTLNNKSLRKIKEN